MPDMTDDQFVASDIEDNTEVLEEAAKAQQEMEDRCRKRYAGGRISREDLIAKIGGYNHQWDEDIIRVYADLRGDFGRDTEYFVVKPQDKGLYGIDGTCYIREAGDSDLDKLYNEDAKDPNKRVFKGVDEATMTAEQKRQFADEKEAFAGFVVEDAFYKFLASLDRWDFVKGRFDSEMARRIDA